VGEVLPGVEAHANLLSGLFDDRVAVETDRAHSFDMARVVAGVLALLARLNEVHGMRAQNRAPTIMFCDRLNFTRVSETLAPEELRHLAPRFFCSMTAAIREHRAEPEGAQ
jgi:class 3 adenylate cyclase